MEGLLVLTHQGHSMTFTPEEIEKLKAMMMYLVKKKHQLSEGNCGFHLQELQPIMDELAEEGKLIIRPTINKNQFFINHNYSNNETKAHAEEVGQ